MSPDPDPLKHPVTAEDEIRAVLEQARSGDATALPELRRVLDDHPEIWRHYGALANHVRQSWIDLIAATDLTLKESLIRQVEAMKASLAGSNPSPLELLLVERIVACWLQTCHADASAAQIEGLSKRQAEFTVKRQDSAHRRCLMAIATLPMTRRLLAAAQPKSGQSARSAKASSRSGAIAVEGEADKNEVVLGCVPAHTNQVDRDARRPRRAGGPAER